MTHAPEYVAARTVLLDALTALHEHLDNLILVGAQAVYAHTGQGELAQPPTTTDADLAVNAADLATTPEICAAMTNAGFSTGANPGSWRSANDIAVDIMVAPHQAGTARRGARGARLDGHERSAARITAGLEPALVDNSPIRVTSFRAEDHRMFTIRVAGPAALLVAKAVKLGERLEDAAEGRANRVKEKDALDMFRLLQSTDAESLVKAISLHTAEPHAKTTTERALQVLSTHGASVTGVLPTLSATAAGDDPVVAASFAALTRELLGALAAARPDLPTRG